MVAGCLVWTTYKYRQLLQADSDKQMVGFAKSGQSLPQLSGHSYDGSPITILPQSSKKFLLMVFRQGCTYCTENWPYWDRILADQGRRTNVILYSTDDKISDAYKAEHAKLSSSMIILGANPKVTATLGFDATPQTILVDHGRVVRNWPGVLTNEEASEILRTVKLGSGGE